jgi:hypothetical protein|tara:strand:- start:8281 stop:8421 length:141 start_codon:yes stop_codon:yes gene_type:complete
MEELQEIIAAKTAELELKLTVVLSEAKDEIIEGLREQQEVAPENPF